MSDLKYFESLSPVDTRQKEIKEYLNILVKGLSAQLIGLPGSGKSNILRLLAYNTTLRQHYFKNYENTVHFVYINGVEIKNKNFTDIAKLIFSSISFSLNERRMTNESEQIKTLLQEGLSFNDEALFFQYLKRAVDYLTIEKKLTLVVLFDRFDTVAPNLTEEFFSNLKSLRNHAKYRFGVIFSLTRPLEDTVDIKILSDFHDVVSGNQIYVSVYDPISIEFRLDYIEKAARNKVSPETRKEIVRLTGGHSKLTKLSFEKIVSEEEEVTDLKDYLLSQGSIKRAIDEIWSSLMPSEKEVLKLKLPFDEIKDTHPYLVKSGLVNNSGISIPLLKDYIDSIDLDTNESITYSAERNEILKGDTSISKDLSSSEFKLLRFLIENKEKVLTKDEIISVIWTDQKTQEGVTDQALDQIFYRLRKKVERDPKNPHFIHTIKGTGYKFTP